MIVVKIELWPYGQESQAECLGKAEIVLIDIDESNYGTYKYNLLKWGRELSNRLDHKAKDVWKSGEVGGHHRSRRGPWDLLFRVLRDAVGNRADDD